ncbi:MAG: YkvA family protein [Rhizobiaceae bacterium]
MDDVKIGEILAPVDEAEEKKREERVRTKLWRTARRAARQVPFMDEVIAGYFCALDPQTPTRVKGVLLAALAYFVLPLDSIPDFLLGFGFTDDVAVLTAALTAIRSHITDAHRDAARTALEEKKDG